MKKFNILLNFGRVFDVPTDPIASSDLLTVEKASTVLNQFTYPYDENTYTIHTDWSEVLAATKRVYSISQHAEKLHEKDFIKWYEELPKENELINLQFFIENNDNEDYSLLIYRALYESFLAFNFSSPGSFSCHSCKAEFKTIWEMEGDGYFFETAWLDSIKTGWPEIQHIELDQVVRWLRSLNINVEELAKTKMQRAIFAILHACKNSPRDPGTIIWLSYALEAIYETPVGQAFTILYRRILNFLEPNPKFHKKIKKKLRAFYDERHKFAHGHSPIVHPLEDYDFDSDSEKHLYKIQLLNGFVFNIVLASVQKMIRNSWSSINFEETLNGVMIDNFSQST